MQPNVLILYPDQMRADCMSAAGHPLLKTPGLDRLAREGVRFTQAYTSYPLCCPFRASLLTGKYATSHGMVANHYPIDLAQTFLPQLMRDSGYATCWVGKWHLNGGRKHDFVPKEYRLGFEHFVGFSRGHAYLSPIYYRDDDTTPYRSDMFEPEMQTGQLCDFIDDALGQGRPFFAGIGYGPPHVPVDQAPEAYRALFSPDEVPLSDLVPPEKAEEARRFIAMYWGMVAAVDHQVQRILNHLQHRQALDNTMVILVSDHGDMCYEHGLTGKKTFYRGAMQVPFLIRYPAYGHGREETHLADPSVSIMPTILEACGITPPAGMDGQSLHTLLTQGHDETLNDFIFYQIPKEAKGPERHPFPERGLRTAQWLYVERCGVPVALFNEVLDPDERFNLAFHAGHYAQMDQLHRQLETVMARYGDSWDIHADFPPVNFQTHEEGKIYNQVIFSKAQTEPPRFSPG